MPESLSGAWQEAIDRRAPELETRILDFLNGQLERVLRRILSGKQPMVADENEILTAILIDYYDRDLARQLLAEPPPGATQEEAKSYRTLYGTVQSLNDVFQLMQSRQDALAQARLINETTRVLLEQFIGLGGGADETVRSFLELNPNFSNVTKAEFEGLVAKIREQVEETYHNRARTIARTELAVAQSKTVAQELRAQGKTHVRIYDGLGCGWRHHDDGDYANGSLRLIEDYLNYPIAHPNCVRAGYPDFFGGNDLNAPSSIGVSGKKELDLFDVELKFNPNHDGRGRFATSGSGSFQSSETGSDFQKSPYFLENRDAMAFGGPGADGIVGVKDGDVRTAFLNWQRTNSYTDIQESLRDPAAFRARLEKRNGLDVSSTEYSIKMAQIYSAGMDSGIAKSKAIGHDVDMFRATHVSVNNAARLTPGAVFTEKGFSSVSPVKEGALQFINGKFHTGKYEGEPVLFRIKTPATTRAAYLKNDEFPDIHEHVLARGTSFRVVSTKQGQRYEGSGMFGLGAGAVDFTEVTLEIVS